MGRLGSRRQARGRLEARCEPGDRSSRQPLAPVLRPIIPPPPPRRRAGDVVLENWRSCWRGRGRMHAAHRREDDFLKRSTCLLKRGDRPGPPTGPGTPVSMDSGTPIVTESEVAKSRRQAHDMMLAASLTGRSPPSPRAPLSPRPALRPRAAESTPRGAGRGDAGRHDWDGGNDERCGMLVKI